MKKLMALGLVLLIAACGSTTARNDGDADDGPYTQKDLEHDTNDVYRPSDSGKDDDGVNKGSREKTKPTC